MTGISAGTLIHRIRLEKTITTQDTLGAPQRNWVVVKVVWANITPITARNVVMAQRLSTEITHQIIVRYQSVFSDVRTLSDYRAIHRGRIFKIHGGINEDEENVVVTLYASEGVDDG